MSSSSGEHPVEAYGRFTNPERYRVLHEWGWQLLARLDEAFDVERVDAAGDWASPIPGDFNAPAIR
ncbi:MAG: DUF6226 family protein, partial [Nocardioidaceae bacterium]